MQRGQENEELSHQYEARLPTLDQLREEAAFELSAAVRQSGVKIHSQVARVKSLASFLQKAARKEGGDPITQITDSVGLRVVTLFISDIPRLAGAIRANFDVREEVDSIEGEDVTSFGYMSLHLVVELKHTHQGPRYDLIKGIPFEIQIRTILMDAWANVSHYLDYKTASSIPSDLRRDFYALNGLFYVADKHFELFFGEKAATRDRARSTVETQHPDLEQEVNLETLQAYLNRAFPKRKHAPPARIAEFVDELKQVGYGTLAKLETALLRGRNALASYEESHPPSKADAYADVGAARAILAMVDEQYRHLKHPHDPDQYAAFDHLMRAAASGQRFEDPGPGH